MGQFHSRLQLLRSFETMLQLLEADKAARGSLAIRRVHRTVSSLVSHYSLADSQIAGELAKGRAPLQKDIMDYIKLASWKDVNVLALKQSAEKTHRHLHRCVRKYRDLLRTPVTLSLNPATEPRGDINLAWAVTWPQREYHFPISSRTNAAPHLLHLPRTYSRFNAILKQNLAKRFDGSDAVILENVACQIFDTLGSFTSVAFPIEAKAREKAIKSLSSRKRRALSDLSKELRRLGVPPNVQLDAQARQESRSKLFEVALPLINANDLVITIASKGDRYYHQLIDGLQAARSSMSNHHSDFTTRDLQHLLSLTESLFSKALLARERCVRGVHSHRLSAHKSSDRLSQSLPSHRRLDQIVRRLRSFTEQPPSQRLSRYSSNDVCQLSKHLNSALDSLRQLLLWAEAPLDDWDSRFLEEFRAHIASSQALVDLLSPLRKSIEDEAFYFCLRGVSCPLYSSDEIPIILFLFPT
jgi:midasin